MAEVAPERTDDDVDQVVEEILRTFAFRPLPSARWRQRLADLQWIVQADYAATMNDLVRDGSLPLREMEPLARRLFPEFNQQCLHFSGAVARFTTSPEGPRASSSA